ncbi:uncharacterized protein LOC101219582 [Cucumis sativus]|uniref:C2H2-type domain-containing protein n=1 Tax=Cucumis sativus TaxID=3659 RepID=A0A0A0L8D2_CUCSA|nr:uncharacterized protein LOC101219582 [Cucumis sativus]KGN58210.1 hypothetical protein Csa_017409 [Cucumis sativus]
MGRRSIRVALLIFSLLLSLRPHTVSSTLPLQSLNQGSNSKDSASESTPKQDWNNAHEVHCSRERSRAAWKVIEEYLMPFVEKKKYKISTKCRLHPDNDMFRDQEQHKSHLDFNDWKCGYCRKRFYEEKYIDQHFDNRHYNLLNVSRNRCLADLCGALHCDHVIDAVSQKSKCNPAAAARNKHMCEGLADSCFPVDEGALASHLHEFFLHQFCDAHTCSGKPKPFSRGRQVRRSVFYIVISVLTILFVMFFYVFFYLYNRGMRTRPQVLKRLSQSGRKKKPS